MTKPAPDNPRPEAWPSVTAYLPKRVDRRMLVNRAFVWLCLGCIGLAVGILGVLLLSVVVQGAGTLSWRFITSPESSDAMKAGIFSGLVSTILLCLICALTAIPLGVGTAVLIEEFRPRQGILARCHSIIEVNIRNLAGVPSIVYGILGVAAFVMMGGLFGDMNAGKYAIGQTWYDEYTAEDRVAYYIPVAGRDAPATPSAADMSYTTAKGGSEQAGLTFLTAQEVEPQRDAIEAELGAFKKEFREQVRAVRGERGRGPVSIASHEQAAAMTDALLATGEWQCDLEKLRAEMIPLVLKLDGLERRELSLARSDVRSALIDAEYAARMPGVMMVGREPVRRDKKAWYYLALPLGRGVMAGGLTLMLVILPIIIVASQEALRAVPDSLRQASLAMGATRWQVISTTVLPSAIPGICTGTILAISRAIGEAAPLLIVGAVAYLPFVPKNPMDSFSAMPIQIYFWTGKSDDGAAFQALAASGIIVLLFVLLFFNAIAVYIRQRTQQVG